MKAVITGGTKGIGKAIAVRFAQEGYDLCVCARSKEDLSSLKQELEASYGIHVFIKVVDVSSKSEVVAFGEECLSNGNIDILVNNAGIFIPGQLCDEAEGQMESMMATNLYSAYHLSRVIAPDMKQRQQGHIFNICSVASLQAYDNGGSYSISKYALAGFSTNLRHELKPSGVKVTSVFPGATWSASWAGVDLPKERLMQASDIASLVWNATQLSPSATVEDIVVRPQLGDL